MIALAAEDIRKDEVIMSARTTLPGAQSTKVNPLSQPPPPPKWATRSTVEDGGITHETVSAVHPRAIGEWPPNDAPQRPVEISLSVVDRLSNDRWVRTGPTVQVEGGAYPAGEIPELVRALLDVSSLLT
jgi:hypothetical protein